MLHVPAGANGAIRLTQIVEDVTARASQLRSMTAYRPASAWRRPLVAIQQLESFESRAAKLFYTARQGEAVVEPDRPMNPLLNHMAEYAIQ